MEHLRQSQPQFQLLFGLFLYFHWRLREAESQSKSLAERNASLRHSSCAQLQHFNSACKKGTQTGETRVHRCRLNRLSLQYLFWSVVMAGAIQTSQEKQNISAALLTKTLKNSWKKNHSFHFVVHLCCRMTVNGTLNQPWSGFLNY